MYASFKCSRKRRWFISRKTTRFYFKPYFLFARCEHEYLPGKFDISSFYKRKCTRKILSLCSATCVEICLETLCVQMVAAKRLIYARWIIFAGVDGTETQVKFNRILSFCLKAMRTYTKT